MSESSFADDFLQAEDAATQAVDADPDTEQPDEPVMPPGHPPTVYTGRGEDDNPPGTPR